MAFPTSIELASFFGIPYNNLSTTLSQLAGISDTTLYVASTTNFDAIGEVTIEDEVIYHTGKTAGSFTGCTRAYGNTTAAEHAAGKQVSLTFTATMWANMVQEVRAIMTALGASLANIASLTNTVTLTNKRITKREVTIASSATPTPNADITDIYTITALAAAATFGAPTGTPTQGQCLLLRFKDNATARAIGHNAIYRAVGVTLLTTTVISKTHYELFIYNFTDTKWDCVAVGSEV